jgi:outer membrane protein assembly factor BamD (BamD/ComL family)
MRMAATSLALLFSMVPAIAQQKPDGPSGEKAHKTYKHALEALRDRRQDIALDEFKKADKQDGGHCRACQKQMIKYGIELGEWKLPSSLLMK